MKNIEAMLLAREIYWEILMNNTAPVLAIIETEI